MHGHRPWTTRVLVAAAALPLVLTCGAVSSGAVEEPDAKPPAAQERDVLTSVVAEPVALPRVVRAADGRRHVVHELLVTNANPVAVEVTRVDVLAGRSHDRLARFAGTRLDASMRTVFGKQTTRLAPGQVGFVVLDVRLQRGSRVPSRLVHVLTVKAPSGARVRIPAGATRVGTQPPTVVAPPLRGARWVNFGGCCGAGAHRSALQPVNGDLHLSQRYAVDIVRMTPGRRMVTGPLDELESYPGYGAPVRAATAGRVIRVVDRHPDQVPLDPEPVALDDLGGNLVGIAAGDGRFVWYAHLAPDSVRVEVGDRVRPGQVLGLLGNSGNTTMPHLHFQVSDGPSLLGSEGLPWVLRSYRSRGAVPPLARLDIRKRVPVRPLWRGEHRRTLPLERQVLRFG
jgi:hypothetical protein